MLGAVAAFQALDGSWGFFDRALGYGLKDVSGFKNTHLHRV